MVISASIFEAKFCFRLNVYPRSPKRSYLQSITDADYILLLLLLYNRTRSTTAQA